jgi:hypothetical protein
VIGMLPDDAEKIVSVIAKVNAKERNHHAADCQAAV